MNTRISIEDYVKLGGIKEGHVVSYGTERVYTIVKRLDFAGYYLDLSKPGVPSNIVGVLPKDQIIVDSFVLKRSKPKAKAKIEVKTEVKTEVKPKVESKPTVKPKVKSATNKKEIKK